MSDLFGPILGAVAPHVEISNSEMQTFKGCRRRWWLSYYAGLAPKQKSAIGPLPLGTRIHNALEEFYTVGTMPVDAYARLQNIDNQRFLDSSESLNDSAIKKFNSESELGRIMVEGYWEWLQETNADAYFDIIGAEKKLEHAPEEFGGRVNVIGKVDLRVRRRSDGSRAVLDHKALHVDQSVLTPSGYKRIGDVKVGDRLIAPDGSVTRITGVYPQGVVPLNKVTFSDHTSVLACDDHLWSVYKVTSRDRNVLVTMTTGEMRGRSPRSARGQSKYAIPTVDPGKVEFPERSLPIGPYTLGALLGDGHFGTQIKLTTWDSEIIDEVARESAPDIGFYEKSDRAHEYVLFDTWVKNAVVDGKISRIYPMRSALEELGLRDSRSHDKFIPDIYKYSSVKQRLSILQGIMDTDGFVRDYSSGSTGSIALYCTSKQLVDDVAWVVRSLGGIATVNQNPRPTRMHTNGVVTEHRTGYYVSIRMPDNMCPFRLRRKVDGFEKFTRKVGRRSIRSIDPAGTGEAICIKVDHPDELFITDDFIVTHNTAAQFTSYYNHAHASEQLMLYTNLERRMPDEDSTPVDGGIYNLLKKVKRTGTAKPPFYERIDVRFNKKVLNHAWTRSLGTISDILRTRDALDAGADPMFVAYPSPKMDWNCSMCPFFAACHMFDDGSNVEAFIEDFYEKVDPNARYGSENDESE